MDWRRWLERRAEMLAARPQRSPGLARHWRPGWPGGPESRWPL